ncbi:MAG TPA: class I SAM-dependent methyltransferase [Candidatus Binatia bacterium]|jgi:ubiquinone/menaquinone biosynthesis C-methylase UbiE|nr:class I SAM-dependent methyltransferase [Candidatus Binatia bacterium]
MAEGAAPGGHPWFAAVYDSLMAAGERRFMAAEREAVVGGARGRVLEIGCGTGLNLPYYTAAATERWAVEPDPFMLARAARRAAEQGVAVDLRRAPAESLPFADDFFDTVVSTLVLCTVADPARALAEVRRVLRPGGELRFYEHVRSASRLGALGQDVVTPLWRRIAAGCHPNRDVAGAIRAAGFTIVALEPKTPVPPVPPLCVVRPQVRGVARKETR